MNPLVNIAIKAARAAGHIIIRAMDRVEHLEVREKGTNDFVSEVDHAAERKIIQTIHEAYPEHAILGEESGAFSPKGNDDVIWIIDPLDGTTNFLHRFPHFAVSIGIQVKGRLEHGVIYDPIRHDLFTAARGAGTRCNDRRLRVSQHKSLSGALLGTGFPYREQTHTEAYLRQFKAICTQAAGIRRAGSAALDLAYVAAGYLDGFWEYGLQPWDLAAGVLMIKEAGGLASDFEGREDYMTSGNIVAGNPKIFKSLLQTLHLATD